MFKTVQFRHRGKQLPRRAAKAAGFTFVEVMICTVIMVVVFISFYSAISAGILVVENARDKLRATQVMIKRMEGIRLFTYAQLTQTNLLPTTFTDYYYPNATNGSKGTVYTGTVSVTQPGFTATYSTNSMLQITINVNWNTLQGSRSAQMTTYASQWGIQNYVITSN